MKVYRQLIIVLLLAVVVFAGCATSPENLASDPQSWDGKTVTLSGEVGTGFSIPATGFSVFSLAYADGNAPLVATSPRVKGRFTKVTGEVWAFPARGMSETSADAVYLLADFLMEKRNLDQRRAREVAALIFAAVNGISESSGPFWFIIEL